MDPLDLFSDNARGMKIDATSSPVSKEHELARLKQQLLKTKAELLNEVNALEIEWNELSNTQKEETEKQDHLQKEEEDAILKLLLEAEEEDRAKEEDAVVIDKPVQDTEGDEAEEEEEEEEDDLSRYDARPSKKWDVRFEYLKRFYPNTFISNVQSRIGLEYLDEEKTLVKNMSFDLNIGNVIKFEIIIKLIKFQDTYQVFDLIPTKLSQNKLNHILSKISNYFTQRNNINALLLTLNNLYELLERRQKLFNNSENWTANNHILNNCMSYRSLILYYDIIFEDGELQIVYTTNKGKLNSALDLSLRTYGVEVGLQKFIENVEFHLAEVVTL